MALETQDFPVQSLGGSLGLVVMSEEGAFAYPLPKQGQVTLGRDPSCEIRLHGFGVSRQHAKLGVGATIQLVDLASRNGTLVGDRRLVPNELTEIHLGEAIRIGEVVLVLQPQSECSVVRFFTRSAFELHVDREVTAAAKGGATFAFARVVVESVNTAAPADGALARLMSEALEPTDLLCTIGPRDVEVVLGAVTPAGAEDVSTRIQAKLAEGGFRASVGMAFFPDDGETREQLQRVAESRLRGGAGAPRSTLDTGALKKLVPVLERIAGSTINVLIAGETGVGKEVLAHAIHEISPRAGAKLVCLNCCALSEPLLESELFGHERGAFTGAVRAKPGLLETADGGTLFLDEVGEMPLSLQAKFLRVLEQKEVTRVGALRPRPIDIRIVSASNRNLEAEIRAERFRQDLYFRLNGVTIVVPPLRERLDEIEPLARGFVENTTRALGRRLPAISGEALAALRAHSWPGNVRELRNVMERAVVLCAGDEIRLEHLPFGVHAPQQWHPPDEGRVMAALAPPRVPTDSGRETLPVPSDVSGIVVTREEERERTIAALRACKGNQTRAAEMLGISRRTLVSRLTEFGLPRPRKQVHEPKT